MSNIYFKETLNKEFRLVGKFFNRLRNIFVIQPTSMLFNYPIQFNDTLKFKKAVTNESTLSVTGAVTNESTLDVSGSVTTGALTTSGNTSVTGTIEATDTIFNGWHGHKTRIKILPRDFLVNDDSINARVLFDEDAGGIRTAAVADELYATIAIPTGYQATHARIYSSDTSLTVTVYKTAIGVAFHVKNTLGSGTTNAEIDIEDTASDDTNYLVIGVATAAIDDLLYGGYITIEKI